jgi:Zn-dependent membrane protease YugP
LKIGDEFGVLPELDTTEVYLQLFVFVEDVMDVYFDAPDGAIDMSLFAILLFGGTMALSLWATMRVRQVYGKFSQLAASSGSSGAETAATILGQEGIYDVEIVEHDEVLGDHYDPIHKRLVLSRDNFRGASTAALGVAAHECGHAIQHKQAYAPCTC